jgi:predicted secreted protein
VSESDDLRAFIRDLMDESDRKLTGWEARAEEDLKRRPDFTEARKQTALLRDKIRRMERRG